MTLTTENIQMMAATLYDDGWTSEDGDWLMDEYEFTPEEVDLICQEIRWIEDEQW